MKWLAAAVVMMSAAPAFAQTETSSRDLQWIFRDRHGDGSGSPTAVFLSWNYAEVILKAECKADEFGNPGKAGNGGISLYYYPGSIMLNNDTNGTENGSGKAADGERPFEPFAFSRSNRSISFPATVIRQVVVGHIAVTPKLLSILKPGTDDLEIEAANEMDEPWYVGQAEPLYRLAQTCAEK